MFEILLIPSITISKHTMAVPLCVFPKIFEKKIITEEMGFGDNDVGEREKSKRIKKTWNVVVVEEAPSYRQRRKELVIR